MLHFRKCFKAAPTNMKFLVPAYVLSCIIASCSAQPVRDFDVIIPSTDISLSNTGKCNRSTNTEFQTLINTQGNIYIGATNSIIQLSTTDLTVLNTFITGPDYDVAGCVVPHFCEPMACRRTPKCMDNYNRYLIPYRDQLLACGTIHAVCDLLTLSNISTIYPAKSDLKCQRNDPNHQTMLSTRSQTLPLVAAIHVNENVRDKDVLYFGRSGETIKILLAPTKSIPFFSLVGDAGAYAYRFITEITSHTYHLAWTTPEYAYILWFKESRPPETNKILMVRFCHQSIAPPIRTLEAEEVEYPMHVGDRSYTRMELRCFNPRGQALLQVLDTKFVNEKLYIMFGDGQTTTLCSASLSEINARIDFARYACLNLEDASNVARFLGQRTSCVKSSSNYEEYWSTCGFSAAVNRFLSPIDVVQPLVMERDAALSLPRGEDATAFTVGKENNLFAAFIGTSHGKFLKVRLGNDSSFVSEQIVLRQNVSAILSSVVVDESGDNVFAITSHSILKAAVADCEGQYKTCTECLGSLDPYCGWCVLQGRCTRKAFCDSSDQTDMWVGPTMLVDRCPRISVVQPNLIAIGTTTQIDITFDGTSLQADLVYNCEFLTSEGSNAFSGSILENAATSNSRCLLAATNASVVSVMSDHENITLNIKYNENVLISSELLVYECSNIKALNPQTMCSSCVSSRWGCSWCLDTATCSSSTCPNLQLTLSEQCPRVTGLVGITDPIPVAREKSFFLSTTNLPTTYNYMCRYNFCGKENSSNAVVNSVSRIVQCTATAQLLTCQEDSSDIEVTIYHDDYTIDTIASEPISVTIFNCSVSTNDCGRCLAFRRRFEECAWCESESICQPTRLCSSSPVADISECPAAFIDSVTPLNGPTNGGTLVTIGGRNLGSVVDQITYVLVGGVNCTIQPEGYVTSLQIVCLTQTANTNGPVQVFTSYSTQPVQSSEIFVYRTVEAFEFTPMVVLARSTITIHGMHLDVGNDARIYLAERSSLASTCFQKTSTSLTCQLPPYFQLERVTLTLEIDGFSHRFKNLVRFAPVPDYLPKAEGPILAFKTGGGTATLQLSSLEGVHTATLSVGGQPGENCSLNNNDVDELANSVTCRISKRVSPNRRRRQAENDDSQEAVLTLNEVHNLIIGLVSYVEDPRLDPISSFPCDSSGSGSSDAEINSTEVQASESISTFQIPGKNFFASDADNSEYTIYFNPANSPESILCNVSYITATSLFCKASSLQLKNFRNHRLTLEISIGELLLTAEDVPYCSNQSILVVLITVPILVFLIIVIFILVLRHKVRIKKEIRERRTTLRKLDDLENKTRVAARNAYFELQADYMDNLSENLTHRITYQPTEIYFIQTLFNVSSGHEVLDKTALQQESTSTMEAIEDWLLLLKNKDFLMIFVRTLEEQKKFNIQEKGNVASLLTICLFSDMPYFTSIMFDLLTELIHKHVQKNPKLLLRRSESVVEKMVSHWLSITLYDECIMEKSGKPIFLLTKALHYLVNSAPCDVIAHKALNSLNESTLLGQEISFDTMILRAQIEDKDSGVTSPITEVTVVNVDSITQAKAKIIEVVYKDRPYSELPMPDDLAFELHGGIDSREGLVLCDIDSMSSIERNFKKINTLKHYNVPNKAHVILKPIGVLSPVSQSSEAPLLQAKSKNIYHLVRLNDDEATNGYADVENGAGGKGASKFLDGMIQRPFQEIFLTRMVRSKSTVQDYVEGVFKSILCPDPIPYPVRYFFQFLDREAARHKINDDEVVHIWKTNSLLLRYWVNVLKNPEFLFDVNKTPIVDSCLTVITQAFMDACTTTNRKLGYDSPSNKLLYAKDATRYKSMVKEFFIKVANTPWMKEEDIDNILRKNSQQYANKFNAHVASKLLYKYLFNYKEQIIDAVREHHEDIARKIDNLIDRMEGKIETETTIV